MTVVTNLFLVIPPLPAIFVLLLGSTSPPTLAKIIVLLALATWAPQARIIRSQVLSVRTRDFVLAASACGERRWRVIVVEILPHVSSLALYLLVNTVLLTITTEFNLEFLGLTGANGNIIGSYGWGNLLWNASYDGEFVAGDWWVWGFPALGITMSVVAFVLIAVGLDGLRRARFAAGL